MVAARPKLEARRDKGLRFLAAGTCACLAALVLALALAGPARAATTTWDRDWGKNVNGGGVFGVCTVATNCMIGTPGGLGGEMSFPQADATDSSGNVYVVDQNRRVSKFDSSGNFLRAWGKDVVLSGEHNTGTGFEICVNPAGSNPDDVCQQGQSGDLGGEEQALLLGIATDSNDNVYITDFFRVQKYDSSGNWLRSWGKDVVLSGEHNTGTGFEICVNPAGSNPDDVCQEGGGPGGKGGEMNGPLGIATDSSDNVYVADSGFDRIQKFDSSGNWQRAWGKGVVLSGEHNTGSGFEICVNPAGSNPDDVCQSGDDGFLGGEMTAASGIATDSSANVYISDGWNRIQKFDSSGNWQRAWGKGANGGTAFGICTVAANCKAGTTGGMGGEMDTPFGLTINSGGTVVVGDTYNHRIQEFDPSGAWQRAWGRNVNGGGNQFEVCTVAASCQVGFGFATGSGCEISQPFDVATDSGGNLYIADGPIYRIEKYVPDPQVPPEESVCTASVQPPPVEPPIVPVTTPTTPATTTPAQAQTQAKKKKHKKKKKKKTHKIEPQFTG